MALHVVLLPALYFGLGFVVRSSHEALFVQHARTFARVIADEFEIGAALDRPGGVADVLDLAIIHGEGNFAEILYRGKIYRSELSQPGLNPPRQPDLGFVQGGDDTYFIVLPIVHRGENAELRLGFNEQPTRERIQLALDRMLSMLAAYLVIAMGIALVLSHRLSRPIHALQTVSRTIASGDYARTMHTSTGILELHELAEDLEGMRRELVGVNERLQAQVREKESLELRREELQRQLRQRQRLETVGTLAGGVAHEFNNVLVPIILFTQSALDELPPDSSSRADLERVLHSARRAKDVVQKILTFSRELGDTELRPIDLRAVVKDAVNLFSALAPPNIEIRTQVPDAMPDVRGEATLALQLLMNLCTNAYQAMQGRHGQLTIGLRHHEAGGVGNQHGACVELWVQDTGHGMDGATVERIFEPFYTTRTVGEGTGLGLSVVHGIVESFGGNIRVDTQEDIGTTFRVFFPLTDPAGAAQAEPCGK
ncbi:MAG: ATP-binding protein [Steroidobacteraceae bacterium]